MGEVEVAALVRWWQRPAGGRGRLIGYVAGCAAVVVVAAALAVAAWTGGDELAIASQEEQFGEVAACRAEVRQTPLSPLDAIAVGSRGLEAPIVFELSSSRAALVIFAGDSAFITCRTVGGPAGFLVKSVSVHGYYEPGDPVAAEIHYLGAIEDGRAAGADIVAVLGRVGRDVTDVELELDGTTLRGRIIKGWFAIEVQADQVPRVGLAELTWTTSDATLRSMFAVPPDFTSR